MLARGAGVFRSPALKKYADAYGLFFVILLWGSHLAYPMHRLQNVRGTMFGYAIPLYYFFVVILTMGAALVVLTFKRNWTRWELLWCALPLICLPGILNSADVAWSFRQWVSWIIRGVIPGGIIFITAQHKKIKFALKYGIYPIIVAASVLGLSELYYDNNPYWKGFENHIIETSQMANPFYRPSNEMTLSTWPQGTQGNRIPFTSTVIGFLPLGLWLLKYRHKRFYLAHLCAVGAIVSLLLMAQVRATWVGTAVIMVAISLIGLHRNRYEAIKFIAGVLVCLGVFLVWPKAHDMLLRRFHSFRLDETSIRGRLDVLRAAIVALKSRWFFGVGFGQFPWACKSFYQGETPWKGTPDNQYLRWAIENGIPSLSILVAFLGGLIRAGWNRIRLMKDSRQADFYKSLLVGWVGVAVTFLFFDGFYWGACNMTFWCLLGLFATCLSSEAN